MYTLWEKKGAVCPKFNSPKGAVSENIIQVSQNEINVIKPYNWSVLCKFYEGFVPTWVLIAFHIFFYFI